MGLRSRVVFAPVFLALSLVFACSTADLKTPTSADGTSGGGSSSGSSGVDPDGGLLPDGAPAGEAGPSQIPATTDVTIQVQPTDNGLALVNAIKGAKKSVHMEMYLLSSNEMIGALVDLKDAGKDVKVILNQTFPTNGGSNADAFTTLKNAGVDVVWAPQAYQYTHAKTIIIDGERLVVMTMNLTFTSASSNREYIATDTDPDDVADAEKIFAADFANVDLHLPTTKLVLSPSGATPVDARSRLAGLITSATTSLDVEVQSLSDDVLVDAIVDAHQAGVAVRIVLDADTFGGTGQENALSKLKASGVPIRKVSSPDIHAKAIVVDGARAFVGSQNMTPTGLTANREVGVITDAAAEVAKVKKAIDSDYAKGFAP